MTYLSGRVMNWVGCATKNGNIEDQNADGQYILHTFGF